MMKGFYLFSLLLASSLSAQPYRISVSPNPPHQNQVATVTVENLGIGNSPALQLVYNTGNGSADMPIQGGVCNSGNKVCAGNFTVPPSFFLGLAAKNGNAYVAYTTTAPLSVSLNVANVSIVQEKVLLSWQTASENQNTGFVIEKKNKEIWEELVAKNSGGTSVLPQNYAVELPYLHPGMHELRLSEKTIEKGIRPLKIFSFLMEIPEKAALSTVYPNPLTQNSVVEISVVQTQKISLDIYNVLGEKIQQLFEGVLSANQIQKIEIGDIKLPKGVYFLRAMGENFITTQKLIQLTDSK